ncbi:hypothetical protein [Zobellia galactanivorans]|uniref:Conserved hypothetical lipoprotein n=1 Tax=Zobellia galactanivorans (strain DSM 12802 / CCUG 47099 / CIP 106680 / NCIMB 13871 / Dsij) TaxID=63186 RepID=G0L279_ZOBGA|nr:hypothetical protein [Zobellia galactanivorans]CAZ97966.1 Conserved hypothetical lipoprotein [Zobellia galactanivorans]
MKKLKIYLFLLSIGFCVISCTNDNLGLVTNDDSEEQETETPTEEENTEEEEDTDENTEGENETPIDVATELIANDLEPHPMQDVAKPEYLKTIVDPSFGTIIRRISNGGNGSVIKPMYSTIQAWNADESRMILYDQTNGVHQLLDGKTYAFIRNLDDVRPDDLEQLFWDFNEADILYYLDKSTDDFIKYTVSSGNKEIMVNLKELTGCNGSISMGNDVQMMSWDSDVIGFRCNNDQTYSYRFSTKKLTLLKVGDVNYTAAMPAPSGNLFYHNVSSYDTNGNLKAQLNKNKPEHSCLGQMANGSDTDFSVSFGEGPRGGCLGNIIAYDLNTGDCIPVISEDLGYDYPKSGTHISAVAHKNPGWIAASMVGFEKDGQKLLDQELVIARVEPGNVEVYRIGHHRADEDEFGYWGEPHAVISPTGTRVLFGSDWSGSEDGKSVESYVVELPSYQP